MNNNMNKKHVRVVLFFLAPGSNLKKRWMKQEKRKSFLIERQINLISKTTNRKEACCKVHTLQQALLLRG